MLIEALIASSLKLLIFGSFGVLLSFGCLWESRKLWRGYSAKIPKTPPQWWLLGKRAYLGYIRGFTILSIFIGLSSLTVIAGVIAEPDDPTTELSTFQVMVLAPFFLLLIVTFSIFISIALTGEPKKLVPPHLRKKKTEAR